MNKTNFDKLIRTRGAHRALTTKLFEKINSNDLKNCDEEEISSFIEQLSVKEDLLKNLDSQVIEEIEIDNLDEEIAKGAEYADNIIAWRHKLKGILEKRKLKVSESDSGVSSVSVRENVVRRAEPMVAKLPCLNIERFYGDPTDFQRFWDQFEAAIDKNTEIANVDKFNYLRSYLCGDAATAISGFSLTNVNYGTAVQTLKERFGNKTLIRQAHLANLMSLEPVKNSDTALRKFYDFVLIQVRNLQGLGSSLESYNNLICPVLMKCLPREMITEITRRCGQEDWEVTKILDIVKTEIQCRETASFLSSQRGTQNSNFVGNQNNVPNYKKKVTFATVSQKDQIRKSNRWPDHVADNKKERKNYSKCIFCDGEHLGVACRNVSAEDKKQKLKREGRCFLCFGRHLRKNCRLKTECANCGGWHNELFCLSSERRSRSDERGESVSVSTANQSESARVSGLNSQVGMTHSNIQNGISGVLPACGVKVQNARGSKFENVLMLYDSASSCSWVTKDIAEKLSLPILRTEVLEMYTFGNKPIKKGFDVTSLVLSHRDNPSRRARIEAYVTDTISHVQLNLPKGEIETMLQRSSVPLNEVKLADKGENISILLGCDIMWKFFSGNKIELTKQLYCIETLFGYVISGSLYSNKERVSLVNLCMSKKESLDFDKDFEILNGKDEVSVNELNSNLKRMWDLDNMFIKPIAEETNNLETESQILRDFEEKIKFHNDNNRYEVKLPFKDEVNLEDNFSLCKRRLMGLVSRLEKNPSLYEQYCKVLDEQLKLGIIEEVLTETNGDNRIHYLPHHPVIKSDKEANRTRFRIVFDASASERGSLSLNNNLHAGPNLNPNLLLLLLKFRKGEIGIVADIEKAFLRVLLSEEDRDCQRFLWVNKMPPSELKVFRNKTVCFGVKPSPFLLAATIKHHIKGYEKSKPAAFKALDSCLYVDDLITSQDTLEDAILVSRDSRDILKSADMNLREFKTNSRALKESWRKTDIQCDDAKDSVLIKVLGCVWNTSSDILTFDISPLMNKIGNHPITKREVLRLTYTVYDPIGIIAPFNIRMRVLLQALWQRGVEWDEALPNDLLAIWRAWCSEVPLLKEVEIPRWYFGNSSALDLEYQLHVFCDASEKAFGAVAYVRYQVGDHFQVTFVTAKARVTPVKKVTLPRLELLAAVIGARLLRSLRSVFTITDNYFIWSDSTVVLHWIKGDARLWKPFVSNRVTEIQENTNPAQWKHCKGIDNPADLLSRGVPARELLHNRRWFEATPWLKLPESEWPRGADVDSSNKFVEEEAGRERRAKAVSANVTIADQPGDDSIIHKFSSWSRLRRVTAWCLRFASNCRSAGSRASGTLSTEELESATDCIVRLAQRTGLKSEFDVLSRGKPLGSSSSIKALAPFIDSKGILRVGGRLANASIAERIKHPILIPKNHPVAVLIIRHHHESNLHGGLQLTASAVRQHFWIVGANRTVKRVLARCVRCHRVKSDTAKQVMADLPATRVNPGNVFETVGTDFAGPFCVKERLGRGIRVIKSYVCVFVCFATRAVHLELVGNLTSESLIATLRRFTARRGLPSIIYSDCGTNYVGAERELRQIVKLLAQENCQDFLAQEGIKWKFNPPAAPHHGGLWEAVVKSMKGHLKKSIGDQILTIEEFLTLINQVEACLNSRPITPILDDVFSYEALTPGHFIIGRSLKALPDSSLISDKFTPLQRWKLVQNLVLHFWKRWSNEYFTLLQKRQKWVKSYDNLRVNDLVLIKEENIPPLKWNLGRILEVFEGKDKRVRVVKLKTQNGELIRPIVKLSPLPLTAVFTSHDNPKDNPKINSRAYLVFTAVKSNSVVMVIK